MPHDQTGSRGVGQMPAASEGYRAGMADKVSKEMIQLHLRQQQMHMVLDGVYQNYHAHTSGGIRHWPPSISEWRAAGCEAAVNYMKNATARLSPPKQSPEVDGVSLSSYFSHRLLTMYCLSESQTDYFLPSLPFPVFYSSPLRFY